MSIDQLSSKSRKTLNALAKANNTTPEKMLKKLQMPIDRLVVTRHPFNFNLG